jgi:NADPH oxidase 2
MLRFIVLTLVITFLFFSFNTAGLILSLYNTSTDLHFSGSMIVKPSSPLDFSDRPGSSLDKANAVSDPENNGPSYLQRNKTERRRLQGLWQTPGGAPEPVQPKNFRQTIDIWLINEGGRQVFFAVWIFLHMLVITFGFLNYQLKDNTVNARATFGVTYAIARTAALVLHVDVIFILLPVCRNFISLLRRTPLNNIIPFDKNLTLHKATAWSMVVFTVVHIAAHMVNFYRLAMAAPSNFTAGQRVLVFLEANFTTGPGVTGWIMTAALFTMVYFAIEKRRRAHFEWFWYTHHLFLIFFINWQLHGMFCMIQPDRPPYCSYLTIGVFWRYWIVGGVIWVYERILREIRSRHRTYISKVVQHPSNVMELQIKKEKKKTRAGQYIFLSCPEISYFQWHPFTLTSAPEEDYISVHIRVTGDFTSALAKAVGCDFDKDKEKKEKGAVVVGTATNPPLNRVLPRVMVDGPFGSASEDFLNYETVLLVGAGIGVTPFASILKSIWYRMNNFNHNKPTRLSKVYFTWVIRDYGSAEWFHSLLQAIEEQDQANRIEISIYLTAKIKEDDVNNIIVQDVGAETDAITSLRAPTHFGRPNWDRVFGNIADIHQKTDVGVFLCGPAVLSKQLHLMCNKWSDPSGTRFFFGKGDFPPFICEYCF